MTIISPASSSGWAPPGEDSEPVRPLSLDDAWKALVRIRNRTMSQTEVAHIAGMHRSAVSKIENGWRTPEIHTIARYADALGIDLQLTLRKKPE